MVKCKHDIKRVLWRRIQMEKPSDYLPLVLARFAEEKYEKDFSQLNDFEAAKQIAFDYKTTVDDIAEYMYSEKTWESSMMSQ